MKKITLFLFVVLPTLMFAQVGIGTNTPDASAKLDISATDKGFLPPRVALTGTTDVATILTPATGLMVYNTATATDVVPGYYYYNGAKWAKLTSDLLSKTEGTNFTGSLIVGHQTTGTLSAANYNTALGIQAMPAITAGQNNTAIGYQSLAAFTGSNILGGNTAVGSKALTVLNTASTTGTDATNNTAIGFSSMITATLANNNTAVGFNSLKMDVSGHQNTAIGVSALEKQTSGFSTAVGYRALLNNTGINNAAIGHQAGSANTTGTNNTFIGMSTGGAANVAGTNNTFLGYSATASVNALTNASAIGNGAIVSASNTIQLGNTSVTAVNTSGAVTALQYKLSALNTAPASATDTGVLGEIRVTATAIYICTATNTWVKAALATF